MTSKYFVLLGMSLFLIIGCSSHSARVDRLELFRHPGAQWLSWSPAERENFVYGYTEGYGSGAAEACRQADDLFETDKPHLIGHDNVPSTYPSARCRESVAKYSNVRLGIDTHAGPDWSAYTDAITSFYEKYPQYREIHYEIILAHMRGSQLKTAEDLYKWRTDISSGK